MVWFDVLPYDPSRRTPGNCIYAWRLANHARINKFGHGVVIASLVHVPDEHRMRHTNRAMVLMAGAAPCRISLNRIRSAAQVSRILTRASAHEGRRLIPPASGGHRPRVPMRVLWPLRLPVRSSLSRSCDIPKSSLIAGKADGHDHSPARTTYLPTYLPTQSGIAPNLTALGPG